VDKFLIGTIEVITEPESTAMAWTSVASFAEQDRPHAKKQNISKINQRKCDEAYIEWGFSCTLDGLQPLCVICGVTLSNRSMKPSLLQRHFKFIP
jgi:hypothetical protein